MNELTQQTTGWILFSSLDANALCPGRGIGSRVICAKVFDSQEAALAYGAKLIRKHADLNPGEGWDQKVVESDSDLMLSWADCLDFSEYFHVFQLVEE